MSYARYGDKREDGSTSDWYIFADDGGGLAVWHFEGHNPTYPNETIAHCVRTGSVKDIDCAKPEDAPMLLEIFAEYLAEEEEEEHYASEGGLIQKTMADGEGKFEF